jgi:hypothetical protein
MTPAILLLAGVTLGLSAGFSPGPLLALAFMLAAEGARHLAWRG